MKYVIMGTAGHVDHGKSALIRALTGTDTDRLKEEKARGISIDLGFAMLPLGDVVAGVVDVPGHERYLKNMLAGTGGMDMVMLVVGADEGVMPQTREHLAMLSVLKIMQGVVVITKIDKVDSDWLEMVEAEVRQLVKGTFLERAPFYRVSAKIGTGMFELRAGLAAAAAAIPVRDAAAPFRLWIDRVFQVKGHGQVVTGTIVSGTVKTEDTVAIYPGTDLVRVRALQWHNRSVGLLQAGQRAAVNIAGTAVVLSRGMLLSAPGYGEVGREWDVLVDWKGAAADSGTRVRLHLGTGEWLGRIKHFRNSSLQYMRLLLEKPLPGAVGDRGLLRLYSPQTLLGGITLAGINNQTRALTAERRLLLESVQANNVEQLVSGLLAEAGKPCSETEIIRRCGYTGRQRVMLAVTALEDRNVIVAIGSMYLDKQVYERMEQKLEQLLAQDSLYSDRRGLVAETIRQQLSLERQEGSAFIRHWQQQGKIQITPEDGTIWLKRDWEEQVRWEDAQVARAETFLSQKKELHIELAELAAKMKISLQLAKIIFGILIRRELVIPVGSMYVYRKTIQYIVEATGIFFRSKSTLTVAEFRDMLNTSRKYALAILEYLDMNKYTIRDKDIRLPGPRIRSLSEKNNF